MSRRGFIPINDLQGYRSDSLALNISLPPYVPVERIGLDVNRLKFLSRLGGIEFVSIGMQDSGQTSVTPDITQINADGSATMSLKQVKQKAEIEHAEVQSDEAEKLFTESSWGKATITVNSKEMDARMMDGARKGVSLRDPKPWSDYLNKAVSKGLSDAASHQLTRRLGYCSKLTFLGQATDTLMLTQAPHNSILAFGVEAAVVSGVLQLISTGIDSLSGTRISERRFSLICGYQLDRLVAVKGLSRTLKLFKSLPVSA